MTQTPPHTPALRFPEFRGAGAWEVKPLCKIADVIAGQSPEGSSYNKEGIGVPFYQGKTNFGDIYLQEPTTWTTQTTKLAQEGDILMSVRAPVGTLNISTGEVCIGRGVASIQAKQNKWYLYYFLKKNEKYIVGSGGSIFDSINKSQIEAIKILIPPTIEEQQKIAACLSSLDEVITAHSDRLDGLKDYKRGLMQQLFPAEGQTTPTLRFPEFRGKDPWEVKPLAEVCEITTGKSNAQDHKDDGIYPLFDRSAEIKKSDKFLFDTEAVIIPGEGMGFIPKYYKGKFDLHQRAYALKDFVCIGKFVYYQMDFLKQFLASKAVLSTILSLRLPIIKDFCIIVPKEPAEQQKIADCLSAMDELITAQADKVRTLKTYKKGLMQQLFPQL